jgi:hypothetical protein
MVNFWNQLSTSFENVVDFKVTLDGCQDDALDGFVEANNVINVSLWLML